MKFKMRVKYEGADDSTAWLETVDDTNVTSAGQVNARAKQIIENFNATRWGGEQARALVSVESIGQSEKHDWQKTNVITIVHPTEGVYDTMECRACGITGKRHGLGTNGVRRDPEYADEVYDKCSPTGYTKPAKKRRGGSR